MSTALVFQSTTFDVVDQNNQPWLQARQIGQALGYSRPDAVLNLYERNKDEFLPTMTRTIEMMVGGQEETVRIFSLRGCHLLAMFARTTIAKAFRVWVLDVLETLNHTESPYSSPQPLLDNTTRLSQRTDPERKALTAMINSWVACAPVHYAQARTIINAHFGVASVDSLTVAQVKQAIDYVQDKIERALGAQQPQVMLSAPEQTTPRLVTFEDQLDMHFNEIHRLLSIVSDHERDIFKIVRNGTTPALARHDVRRSVLVNMHTVMDSTWYAIDAALKAAEFHAKTMCVMSRA